VTRFLFGDTLPLVGSFIGDPSDVPTSDTEDRTSSTGSSGILNRGDFTCCFGCSLGDSGSNTGLIDFLTLEGIGEVVGGLLSRDIFDIFGFEDELEAETELFFLVFS